MINIVVKFDVLWMLSLGAAKCCFDVGLLSIDRLGCSWRDNVMLIMSSTIKSCELDFVTFVFQAYRMIEAACLQEVKT